MTKSALALFESSKNDKRVLEALIPSAEAFTEAVSLQPNLIYDEAAYERIISKGPAEFLETMWVAWNQDRVSPDPRRFATETWSFDQVDPFQLLDLLIERGAGEFITEIREADRAWFVSEECDDFPHSNFRFALEEAHYSQE